MDAKFGTLSNFTRYASAGDGIEKVRAMYDEHEPKLPPSVAALYEFSQLSTDEMPLCFENTFKRSEITNDRSKWTFPKKPVPLINPATTATMIKTWRNNWRDPKSAATDKRRLTIAQVKVHGSLFDFENGVHTGAFKKEELSLLVDELNSAIAKFNNEHVRLDLFDQKLLDGYTKRENLSHNSTESSKKKTRKKKK